MRKLSRLSEKPQKFPLEHFAIYGIIIQKLIMDLKLQAIYSKYVIHYTLRLYLYDFIDLILILIILCATTDI